MFYCITDMLKTNHDDCSSVSSSFQKFVIYANAVQYLDCPDFLPKMILHYTSTYAISDLMSSYRSFNENLTPPETQKPRLSSKF